MLSSACATALHSEAVTPVAMALWLTSMRKACVGVCGAGRKGAGAGCAGGRQGWGGAMQAKAGMAGRRGRRARMCVVCVRVCVGGCLGGRIRIQMLPAAAAGCALYVFAYPSNPLRGK